MAGVTLCKAFGVPVVGCNLLGRNDAHTSAEVKFNYVILDMTPIVIKLKTAALCHLNIIEWDLLAVLLSWLCLVGRSYWLRLIGWELLTFCGLAVLAALLIT